MGLRDSWLALMASLLAFAVVGQNGPIAWAQENTTGPAVNPIAPIPSSPAPLVGPDPVDSAMQPGVSGAPNQNILTPPANNVRRPASTSPLSASPLSASPVSASRNSTRNDSPFSPRLARAPFMLGDSLSPSLVFQDEFALHGNEVPLGGGATRSKIADNSSSLPVDRVFFNYNHFHNAIDDSLTESTNIDRFTVGLEKTFLEQMMSIEVRFPFVADNDFSNPGDFTRNGTDAGNLALTLKGVLTSDSQSLIAAGLTIDTPTGGNTILSDETLTDPLTVDISNDAVHLSPFLGFLCTPGGGMAHQAFIQVDVPTNANVIQFSDSSGVNNTELLEQTLLYLDYQFSKELYNLGRMARQSGCGIQRVLGLAEVHYTTTLENSDVVLSGTPGNPLFEVTSAGNRLDVVNVTLGVQTDFIRGSQLRLGTVAPINSDYDRFYDFEFQAQLNVLYR